MSAVTTLFPPQLPLGLERLGSEAISCQSGHRAGEGRWGTAGRGLSPGRPALRVPNLQGWQQGRLGRGRGQEARPHCGMECWEATAESRSRPGEGKSSPHIPGGGGAGLLSVSDARSVWWKRGATFQGGLKRERGQQQSRRVLGVGWWRRERCPRWGVTKSWESLGPGRRTLRAGPAQARLDTGWRCWHRRTPTLIVESAHMD